MLKEYKPNGVASKRIEVVPIVKHIRYFVLRDLSYLCLYYALDELTHIYIIYIHHLHDMTL
jgi:hypothetical protein